MDSLPPDVQSVVTTVSAVFAELNTGLLIYYLAEPDDAESLTLVYANAAASQYTGAELSALVGQTIGEAFPSLSDTDLPKTYAEVSSGGQSVNLGAFKYEGDERVGPGYFAVKAFPMPARCVGVAFENITLRKKVDELLKKERTRPN
jgi:hypothetical protein